MRKILFFTAIVMCFTSKCVDLADVQSAINSNISECTKNQNIVCINNRDICQKTQDIKEMIDEKYYNSSEYHHLKIACTHNNLPCYIRLRTIAEQLFVFFLRTPECANFATQVASDYFLLPEQTINIQSYNALFRNNKLLIYENPTSLRDIVNDTNPEVNKLLDFNKKLKNLMDFDERRLFIVKEEEYDLTTKAALREVINKLENNRANMNNINELLKEYRNLENYYSYYPNLLNLEIEQNFGRDVVPPRPNMETQNEIKQERRIEIIMLIKKTNYIEKFFIDIMNTMIKKTNYYAIINNNYKYLFNNVKSHKKYLENTLKRESALCVEIAKLLLYYQPY